MNNGCNDAEVKLDNQPLNGETILRILDSEKYLTGIQMFLTKNKVSCMWWTGLFLPQLKTKLVTPLHYQLGN